MHRYARFPPQGAGSLGRPLKSPAGAFSLGSLIGRLALARARGLARPLRRGLAVPPRPPVARA